MKNNIRKIYITKCIVPKYTLALVIVLLRKIKQIKLKLKKYIEEFVHLQKTLFTLILFILFFIFYFFLTAFWLSYRPFGPFSRGQPH